MPKRRLQIQLDEPVYDALRRRARERRASMASLVREAVADSLNPQPRDERKRDYPLTGLVGIAAGAALPDGRAVSEHHDEAPVDAYTEGWSTWRELGLPADLEG